MDIHRACRHLHPSTLSKPASRRKAGASLWGLAAITLAGEAFGSGFAVPEGSIAGLATSNALVANPYELGALIYNPAAMSFHEASSLTLGVLGISPDLKVKTASGSHGSRGREWIAAPTFFGALRVNDAWSLGIGVSAPFGLETKWRLGTFPTLSQPTTAALHPTLSNLQLAAITLPVSYRLNENLSLSAGVDYYSANTLDFNTTLIDVTGTGSDFGWNLGLMYKLERWSFGASYHSSATVTAEGKFQAFPPLGIANNLPIPAKADLDLPWRLQLGARYQVNDALAIELDVTRTGWSKFKEIQVKAEGVGTVLTSSVNDWDDANAYRLGLTYQVTPSTQLRFGYSYDETPQDDAHFSARIPDADRHLLSLGLGYDMGGGWGVEAGYMHVRFKDRNYRSPVPFGTFGTDPNGTNAYDGKYQANVNLVGIGLSKTF